MILKIQKKDARVIPSTTFLIDIGLDQVPLCNPVNLAHQLHRILFKLIEDYCPSLPNVVEDGVVVLLGQILLGSIEVYALNFDRSHLAAVVQFDSPFCRGIPRNFPDRLDRVLQLHTVNSIPLFDHRKHEGRRPDLKKGDQLGHVGITDNDMQSPVTLRICVRLVARVDDAA